MGCIHLNGTIRKIRTHNIHNELFALYRDDLLGRLYIGGKRKLWIVILRRSKRERTMWCFYFAVPPVEVDDSTLSYFFPYDRILATENKFLRGGLVEKSFSREKILICGLPCR